MDIQEVKKWENIFKSCASLEDLNTYNSLSAYNKEEYINGFKEYIKAYNKAVEDANNPSQNQLGGGSSQLQDDGLDHPVWGQSQSNNSSSSQSGVLTHDISGALLQALQAGKQSNDALSALKAADAALQAANQALLNANQALSAADLLNDKALQTGKGIDQTIANAALLNANRALQSANAALEAANKALTAADTAKDAAMSGDSKAEKQAAKEAGKAAQEAALEAGKAENMANRALARAGQNSQQNSQGSSSTGDGQEDGLNNSLAGNQNNSLTGRPNFNDNGNDENLDDDIKIDKAGLDIEGTDEEIEIDLDGDGTQAFDGLDLTLEDNGKWLEDAALEAGLPLDADDLNKSAAERNADLFEKNLSKMKSMSARAGRGTGNSLMDVAKDIVNRLKPTVNWRKALMKLFNGVADPGLELPKMRHNRMGVSDDHPLSLGKYQLVDIKKLPLSSGIMQVFILVDNSGSMYVNCNNGKDIFDNILSEIVGLESKTHIERSAMSYFGAGAILQSQVRTWTYTLMKPKYVLNLCKLRAGDNGGGTSIARAIKSLSDLPKKLYSDSNSKSKRTVLICITDGYDDYGELDTLLTPSLRHATIFLITARGKDHLETTKKTIASKGIPERNIFIVDVDKEW